MSKAATVSHGARAQARLLLNVWTVSAAVGRRESGKVLGLALGMALEFFTNATPSFPWCSLSPEAMLLLQGAGSRCHLPCTCTLQGDSRAHLSGARGTAGPGTKWSQHTRTLFAEPPSAMLLGPQNAIESAQ